MSEILFTKILPTVTVQVLKTANHKISMLPCIQIKPIKREQKILHKNWIFTSKNAVIHVQKKQFNQIAPEFICCVGLSTKILIESLGFNVDICANSAQELIQKLDKYRQYTFFCGNKRLNAIPNFLQQNCQEIQVYQTILLYPKQPKVFDYYVFFSPTAIESYCKFNSIPTKSINFVIGKTTAKKLKEFGNFKTIVAQEPNTESVVNSIYSILNEE